MNARQKRRNKNRVIALTSTVVVLIIAVASYFGVSYYKEKQLKEQAVSSYKRTLEKQDFTGFLALFNQESFTHAGFTKEEALAKYQAIFGALGTNKVTLNQWQQTKEDDNTYAISYELVIPTSMGEIAAEKYETKMIKNEDDWQFEWAPDLIFNQMSGKDTVKITEDKAIRGKIYDRNQKALATDHNYQQLGIVPEKLGEDQTKTDNLKAISDMFDVEIDSLEKALAPDWATGQVFVPIKILATPVSDDNLEHLPSGVLLSKVSMRYYPLAEATAQLIGYTGKASAEDIEGNNELTSESIIGKSGLERSLDSQLRGQNGGTVQIESETGEIKRVILENKKSDGQDITLTLDAKAQKVAFDALQGKPGQVVVNEPTTGELLVATSSPSFDPNKMTVGISQVDYDAYQNDPNLPFIERYATRFAPGSTFKTLTAVIALDAGKLTTQETLAIDGLKWQKDASWGGYFVTRVKDLPQVDLEKALVYSDNIFFAQKTLVLGETAFRSGLNRFIFNEALDLPISIPKATISNEDTFNSDILLADTGYGQGELMIAPITQLSMYSVLLNEGNLIYPQLIKTDDTPQSKANVVSKQAAETVLDDLVGVIANSDGYAHNIYHTNRVLAAKTGTAEIKTEQDTTGIENSFLLFMDKEQKQFMGLILSENSLENGAATEKAKTLVDYLVTNY